MNFFQYNQTLNLPNTTSWQFCPNDLSITLADINKSLRWLSKSELGQKEIDKKQRLLYRKTQFRNQLSHHDPTIVDNNCKICKKKIHKFILKRMQNMSSVHVLA